MNDTAIKIDRGIEFPARASHNKRNHRYPWDEMAVGDSFAYPGKLNSAYAISKHATLVRGYEAQFKAVETEDGVRIWRVK